MYFELEEVVIYFVLEEDETWRGPQKVVRKRSKKFFIFHASPFALSSKNHLKTQIHDVTCICRHVLCNVVY